MKSVKLLLFIIMILLLDLGLFSQVIINEGSNRNYLAFADEDGEYPDWIELCNTTTDTINLYNYSISDNENNPDKWLLPFVKIAPGEFKTVFCSGKDRKPISGFIHVINTGVFNAVVGWNNHELSTPFYWDGVSNLLINTCSYSNTGYTTNSSFNQTQTDFLSTVYSFQDGSDAACHVGYGTPVYQRPNMKLNGVQVGFGTVQNSGTDYPAPYGNWYWGARNQMLIRGSELIEAGLTAGEITSLAFDVVATDPNTIYDYIEIHMKMVSTDQVSSSFEVVNPNNYLHTNFKISEEGEEVFLYNPMQTLLSSLFVNCNNLDNSVGSQPDASGNVFLFNSATPGLSNNDSPVYTGYLQPPVISIPSGFFLSPVNVSISNPNGTDTEIHYTTDGSDPSFESPLYNGTSINIVSSKALKVRAFSSDSLPSPLVAASYFIWVNHTTPILSVITDNANLYGSNGIFDNWWTDWERNAYVEYFDSTKQMIFSQLAGIQVDGGAGGSRSHPQHSFRIELDDGVLGDGPIDYELIPNRPDRTKYGKFYLRNGSNQFLAFPYKDACQTQLMAGETNNYHSTWRPVSVYINGSYFGLYELREKFDTDFFETLEGSDPDSMDILSLSYWYGGALRAVAGNVDSFFVSYSNFKNLNTADTGYWDEADKYFDLTWYTDWIIGESWMGNNDWPWNNIKIHRSNMTGNRWRFCLIDLELSMAPNGWTDCYFDHIQFMLTQSADIPYINVWLRSMQNLRYKQYFINRFADVMNTSYRIERLLAIENNFYNLTVTEMPNEYARWGDPNNINQQMTDFNNNHITFQGQLMARTEQVRNHIQNNFSLPNQLEVTLNVIPEEAGTITISTITPDVYPWQGVYFNGVPVRIKVQANEGYNFSHWGDNGLISDTLNPVFLDTLGTDNIAFNAFFDPIPTTGITSPETPSEFTCHPNPVLNRLYLVNHAGSLSANAYYQVVDLNGRIMKDGALSVLEKETTIDLSSIPPAVYLLRIYNQKETLELMRFVKIER